MKRAADLELKTTALAFFGFLASQSHGGLGSADNKLAGGVVVGHQQQLAALGDGFGHNFFNGGLVELEQGGHATLAFGVGLGHEAATQGSELKGAFGRNHASGSHSAKLAKAVPGSTAYGGASGNGAPEVQVHHGKGGLQGAGVAHGGIVAFPVNFAQGQAADALGLLPQIHGIRRGLGQIAAHARLLRALAGKEQNGLCHDGGYPPVAHIGAHWRGR